MQSAILNTVRQRDGLYFGSTRPTPTGCKFVVIQIDFADLEILQEIARADNTSELHHLLPYALTKGKRIREVEGKQIKPSNFHNIWLLAAAAEMWNHQLSYLIVYI